MDLARRSFRCGLTFLIISAAVSWAGEPPIPGTQRTRMLAVYREQIVGLGAALARAPEEVALYSRRGDRHLFLGNFAEAVADFEKMIVLDPSEDAPHWRLGIAYYFSGQYAQSARQFAKYHAHDRGDRENGLWKFLADVQVAGLESARRTMLVYEQFDREPFPTLYELFASTKTREEFFTDLAARKLTGDPRVMFFANYYAGLNEAIRGEREVGLGLLRAAVASSWGRTAETGPAYMWQVARLHYEKLSAAER